MVKLDISPLEKAIVQLDDSLTFCSSNDAKTNERLAVQFRSAAIQAFEFTYELCWKMIKRYLELTVATPSEVDEYSFNTLIRTANEQGLLLTDLEKWGQYRKMRSTTSHTYDGGKAQEVFEIIPAFLKDAQYLAEKLRQKIR